MFDVVTGQVELAFQFLPGLAVVVYLEPGLPFASVEADDEFGKPGGPDMRSATSAYGHL